MTSQSKNLVPADAKVSLSSPGSTSSKKVILKEENETPWEAKLPCAIHLTFPTPITDATHISLTFQGGFVGTSISMYVATIPRGGTSKVSLGLALGGKIYPEDKNKRQVFEIQWPVHAKSVDDNTADLPTTDLGKDGPTIVTEVPPNPQGGGEKAASLIKGQENAQAAEDLGPPLITELKLEFETSSDHHDRVTVYGLEILG